MKLNQLSECVEASSSKKNPSNLFSSGGWGGEMERELFRLLHKALEDAF